MGSKVAARVVLAEAETRVEGVYLPHAFHAESFVEELVCIVCGACDLVLVQRGQDGAEAVQQSGTQGRAGDA